MKLAVIVPSAGKGRRLRSKVAKPFVTLAGVPLVIRTLKNLIRSAAPSETVLAVEPARLKEIRRLLDHYGLKKVCVVAGGKTRAQSVRNGLRALSGSAVWIMVHDAARPFVTKEMVREVLSSAKKSGAAIVALPATATVKRAHPKTLVIRGTEDRDTLYLAQTPQVFKKGLLVARYRALGNRALGVTDEAALFDGTKVRVQIVSGSSRNVKITTPEDLAYAHYLLKGNRR